MTLQTDDRTGQPHQPVLRFPTWKVAVAGLLGLFGIWLAVRETRDAIHRGRAYQIVRELGGRIGSLTPPIPFCGSEIRIEFHRTQFQYGDLKKLAALDPLTSKHWVGVMFKDTNVTHADMIELRSTLPHCHVFRVVDGQQQKDE